MAGIERTGLSAIAEARRRAQEIDNQQVDPMQGLLARPSPVDRLLAQPNIVARLERGNVPADPSPIAARGFTVRAGDTMADIAARHSIPLGRLLDLNPGLNSTLRPTDPLRAGDRINIPVEADAARGVTRVRDASEALGAPPERVGGTAGAMAGSLTKPGDIPRGA